MPTILLTQAEAIAVAAKLRGMPVLEPYTDLLTSALHKIEDAYSAAPFDPPPQQPPHVIVQMDGVTLDPTDTRRRP